MQCDRLEPVCSQCKRAGKPCGGYRDLSSLMFRSENERAAQLSAEAKAKSRARRRLDALDSISTKADAVESQTSSSIVAISTPLEDQGLRFFINRFVTPMPIRVGGHLQVHNVQDSPFFRHINYDPNIRDAVVSVGLAAIANVNRDSSLRILSREKHAQVIKAVREAVSDPTQANPDRTFPLIVMLSLYEVRYVTRFLLGLVLMLADGELRSQPTGFVDGSSRRCRCVAQAIGISQIPDSFRPESPTGILLCVDSQVFLSQRWQPGCIALVPGIHG